MKRFPGSGDPNGAQYGRFFPYSRVRPKDPDRYQWIGRMGRLAFRAAWGREDLSIVHVNEPKGGPITAAHPLEFHSRHGRWPKHLVQPTTVSRSMARHRVHRGLQPGEVPWEEHGSEIVLECSGKMLTPEPYPYFTRGVRKVIVAAPVKEGALNIVMGVNDHLYDAKRSPHRYRRFLHDQLPGPGGEGYP